jgi:phospholipid transport system substrate-binding protein
MNSRRALLRHCSLVAALVVAGARAAAAQWATDSPAATIATLQQGLIAAAREHAPAAVEARYRVLEPLILATHDLPYIAEFALRRQWGSFSEAERQRFVTAFQRLSVMTYAARFKGVGAETFRPVTVGTPDASGRVAVATAVARAGQTDVTLEYLLQQDAQGWRIINIVADGVSDLALKRAEYQRVLAAGGLAGLLAELETQTQRLLAN